MSTKEKGSNNSNSFFYDTAKACLSGAAAAKATGNSPKNGCIAGVTKSAVEKAIDKAPEFAYQTGKQEFEKQQANRFYTGGYK